MKTQLYEIKVKLSENQKKNLANAFHNKQEIAFRLNKNALSGPDSLNVPKTVAMRLNKNRQLRKGMDTKLTKTKIRNHVGGSLSSSILSVGRTLLPTIGKTLGLPTLARLVSEGPSQIFKTISGGGMHTGPFMVPFEALQKLVRVIHLLTAKQKKDFQKVLRQEEH